MQRTSHSFTSGLLVKTVLEVIIFTVFLFYSTSGYTLPQDKSVPAQPAKNNSEPNPGMLENRKIILDEVSDSPDPFNIAEHQAVTMTGKFRVRRSDVLGSQGAAGEKFEFFVRYTWTITDTVTGAIVRKITDETGITPPGKSENNYFFVTIQQSWNGLDQANNPAGEGVYNYSVYGELIRKRILHDKCASKPGEQDKKEDHNQCIKEIKIVGISNILWGMITVVTGGSDTTPPPVPALLSPLNGAIIGTNQPTFAWQAVFDPSTPVTYILEIASDSGFTQNVIIKTDIASATYKLTPETLAEGAWYWRIRARDGVGNTSQPSGAWSFTFAVDHPPVLTSPGNQSVNENQLLTFTLSATDPDGDAITYSATNLPAGASLNATTGTFAWTPDYTQAGSYTVTFTASAKGLSDSKTVTITVNNVDRAPVLASPGNKTVDENQLLTFTLSAADPDGDAITYSMTPVPTGVTLNATTGVFSWTPNYTQSGSYEVTLKATANSLVDTKTITIIVNNVDRAPVLVSPGNQSVDENQLLTFNLSATDPDGDVITYSMAPVPTGAVLNAGVFTWTPDYTQSGSYEVTFKATANGLSDTKTVTVTINNVDRAPVLTSPGNQTVNENQLLTFTLSATDPDGDAVSYSMTPVPTGATLDSATGVFSWTPDYTQAGNYTITFTATANLLTDAKVVTIAVNNVDRVPVLTSPGNQTVNENQLLTFTLSAIDPDGDAITYSMAPTPTGTNLNATTGIFSWTPDYNQSGSYEMTFKATANGLSDTKTVVITVNNVDRVPALTSPGNQAVNESQLLTFTLSATDPDGDAVTYSMAPVPAGATLDAATGVFSWTPDYTQAGSYEVTFKATANGLSDTKTITIIVNNVDRAPVLVSPGNQAVNESQLLTFTLSATDPDGDAVVYSMTPVISGATLNVDTGEFIWTPDYTQAGSYEVTFNATANGLSDTKTITIIVNNVDRAPVLASPGNQTVNESQLLTFTLSANDPDRDSITYSMTPVPTGAMLDASTGVFSWTPGYTQSGSYEVTFKVTANSLSNTKTITITVNNVDRAPVLVSPGNQAVNEGQLLTFTLSAADQDGDTIAYSMAPVPAGATLDTATGVFSWTPDYGQTGNYTVTFVAAANGLTDSKVIIITVGDVDRPPVLTSPGNKTVNENQFLTFTLSATDPDGDTISYSMTPALAGATLDAATGVFTWTPDYTQAGSYEVTFKATANGLIDTKNVTIMVNNIDRAPVLVSPGNKSVNENQLLTFTLSATDPDGDSITYSMTPVPTGVALDEATGVFAWTPDYTQAGSYEVIFKATTNSLSDTKTVVITVNNVDRAPVLVSPGNQAVDENQLLTFTLFATDPDGDAVTYSMVPVPTGAVLNAGVFTWTPDYTQSGSYELTFKATANSLSDTKTVTITVNNVDRAPVLASPGNQNVNENQLLTFTLSATDPDGDTVVYSMIPVITGTVLNADTGKFIWTPDYTQAGIYEITFKSAANGLSDTKTVTVTVNNVDRAPVLVSPDNKSVNEDQFLTFTLSATDPDGDSITYSMTPVPTGATLDEATGVFAWTPDYTQAGSYAVTFTATANLLTDTKVITITVTNVDRAPVLVSPGNQVVNETQLLTFTLLVTDPDGDAIAYSMAPSPAGADLNAATGIFSWTPDYDQSGSYEIVFKVTANALSDTKTTTIIVNNVDRAPVLASPGNQTVNENQLLTFALSATDPDGDAITYSMTSAIVNTVLDESTGIFNWTPGYDQAGSYEVIFRATAKNLSDTKIVTITVNNVDRAPVLLSPGNQAVNEGNSLTFILSATDPDGEVIVYSMMPIMTGVFFNIDTGELSWTPDYTQSGSYEVTFKATTNNLSDTKTVTITVNNVNQAPVLVSPGNQAVNENQSLIFALSATDFDGDMIAYSMMSMLAGASLDPVTGVFSWTPDYTQAGSYDVTFMATANGLSDSKTITITVNNVDQAPALSIPGNQIVDENQILIFTIFAADPDGDVVTYSMDPPAPAGAVLNPATGEFYWQPDYTQAGSYEITFSALSNLLGDTRVMTIAVNNIDRAPVLAFPGNQAVDEGQSLTFAVTAADPDGDTIAYSMMSMLAGASLDPVTGIFSWAPDYTQAGSYDVTLMATANGLSDSKTITITVNNVDRAPVLASPGNQSMDANQFLTFTVSAVDPDGDFVTYSMEPNLPGAALDPNTGIFNWTPESWQEGSYDVTFKATANGLFDFQTINIKVFHPIARLEITNVPVQAMVGQWIFATVRYLDAQNLSVTVTGRTVMITLMGPAIDQNCQPLTPTYNLEFNDTSEVTTTFAFVAPGMQGIYASDVANPMIFMDNKSVNITNAPMLVAKTGGDNQQGLVNTMLPDRFSVRLTDAFGNPVPEMSTIEFQVIKGSGLFADPPSKSELEKAYNANKGKTPKAPVKSEQPKSNGYQLPYEATGTEFRIKDNPVSPNLKITSSQPIHLWLTAVANTVSLHIEPVTGSAGQADITINGIGDFFKTTDTIYSHQDGAFQKSFDTRKKLSWTQDLSAKHHVYFMAARGTIEIGQNTILTADIMDNIVVTADNITIDGNGHAITSPMPGTGYGIYLNGHSNVTIKNFYIYNFQVGIWCDGGGNNKFLNNRIIDAIGGYYSTYGIEFTGSVSNTVNNNRIWNTSSGIHVCMDAVSNILTNNEITLKSGGMDGIWFINANSNTVANNTLTNGRGICLYAPCTGNAIANNTFSNNSVAMDIWGASDNSIRGNIINNCAGSAVQVKPFNSWPAIYYPRHNQIAENAMQNSNQAAIYLENSDSNYISYNTANSNYYGLYLSNSSNNYVFQNNFFYNYTRNVWSDTATELSFNNQGNYWGHDYSPYFIPGGDSNRSDVVDSYAQGNHVVVMQNRCAVTVGTMGDAVAFWPFKLGELGNDTCVIQAYARGINPLIPEVIPVFFTVKSFYDILPPPIMTSARVVTGTPYTLEGTSAKGYGYQVQVENYYMPATPVEVEPLSGKWKTWPMALTEGVYNFTMQTVDTINLQYSTVITDSFTVDMTPPGVTINSLLTNPTSIYSLNLSATATDTYTNITRAEYWIDSESNGKVEIIPIDGLFNSLTENFSYSIPTNSLANGMHVLYVRVMDAGGNWSIPAQATFIKDTTQPGISIPVVLPNPANGEITITANAIDTFTNIVQAEYWIDAQTDRFQMSAADGIFDNPNENLIATDALQGIADGSHTIFIRACDAAGNWSAFATGYFVKDATLPMVNMNVTLYYATANIVLNGYANDNLTGISQAEYWIDSQANGIIQLTPMDGLFGSLYESFNSPISILSLTNGPHTVYMRVRDAANNWSETVFADFIKDAESPVIPVASLNVTPDPSNIDPTVLATAIDTNSPIVYAEYWIDYYGPHYPMYATLPPFDSQTEDIGAILPAMADGQYYISVRAMDAAGNWSVPVTKQFMIDKTPPAGWIMINNYNPYVTSTNVTVTMGFTDFSGVTDVRFSEDGVNWGEWKLFSPVMAFTLTATSGDKTVWVEARDRAGSINRFSDNIYLALNAAVVELIQPYQEYSLVVTDANSSLYRAEIWIPGAITQPTWFAIATPQQVPPLPDNLVLLKAVQFQPVGINISSSISIKIPFDASLLQQYRRTEWDVRMIAYDSDLGQWVFLDNAYHGGNYLIGASVYTLASVYCAVISPIDRIELLNVPDQVKAGENISGTFIYVDKLDSPVMFTGSANLHLTGVIGPNGGSSGPADKTITFNSQIEQVADFAFAQPGVQRIDVTDTVDPAITAFKYITVTVGTPAVLTKISGDNQSGLAGTNLPGYFMTSLTDKFGSPVAGKGIEYKAVQGGGQFEDPPFLEQVRMIYDANKNANSGSSAVSKPSIKYANNGYSLPYEATGTEFILSDNPVSSGLKITSSAEIKLSVNAVTNTISIHIQPVQQTGGPATADMTISGLDPFYSSVTDTYYCYQDGYLARKFNITDTVHSWVQDISAGHHVYILPRKSTLYITQNTVLTQDLYDNIVVAADNITIDGNGHCITSPYSSLNTGYGIYLNGRTGVTIKNIDIYSFQTGIYMENSRNCSIDYNDIFSYQWYSPPQGYYPEGITLWNSISNVVSDNWTCGTINGILLYNGSSNNILANNNFSCSWQTGIIVENSPYNTLTHNMFFLGDGICVTGSDYTRIINNSMWDNNTAINIQSSHNIVKGNFIDGAGMGIRLEQDNLPCTDNRVLENTIQNSIIGIDIFRALDNYFSYNVIDLNQNGIDLMCAVPNHFFNNNIFYNYNYNVYSDQAIELSYQGQGNWWGHNSLPGFYLDGGIDQPYDSNQLTVVDRYPKLGFVTVMKDSILVTTDADGLAETYWPFKLGSESETNIIQAMLVEYYYDTNNVLPVFFNALVNIPAVVTTPATTSQRIISGTAAYPGATIYVMISGITYTTVADSSPAGNWTVNLPVAGLAAGTYPYQITVFANGWQIGLPVQGMITITSLAIEVTYPDQDDVVISDINNLYFTVSYTDLAYSVNPESFEALVNNCPVSDIFDKGVAEASYHPDTVNAYDKFIALYNVLQINARNELKVSIMNSAGHRVEAVRYFVLGSIPRPEPQPEPPIEIRLAIINGNGQSGIVGKCAQEPLLVMAYRVDTNAPIEGLQIVYDFENDNVGKLMEAPGYSSVTNQDGLAAMHFHYGDKPGLCIIKARVFGMDSITPVGFALEGYLPTIQIINTPPLIMNVTYWWHWSPSDGLPGAFKLKVIDQNGNGINNVEVSAKVTQVSSGADEPMATVLPPAQLTDVDGTAAFGLSCCNDVPLNIRFSLPEFIDPATNEPLFVQAGPIGFEPRDSDINIVYWTNHQIGVVNTPLSNKLMVIAEQPNPDPNSSSGAIPVDVEFKVLYGDGFFDGVPGKREVIKTSDSGFQAYVDYTFGTKSEPQVIEAKSLYNNAAVHFLIGPDMAKIVKETAVGSGQFEDSGYTGQSLVYDDDNNLITPAPELYRYIEKKTRDFGPTTTATIKGIDRCGALLNTTGAVAPFSQEITLNQVEVNYEYALYRSGPIVCTGQIMGGTTGAPRAELPGGQKLLQVISGGDFYVEGSGPDKNDVFGTEDIKFFAGPWYVNKGKSTFNQQNDGLIKYSVNNNVESVKFIVKDPSSDETEVFIEEIDLRTNPKKGKCWDGRTNQDNTTDKDIAPNYKGSDKSIRENWKYVDPAYGKPYTVEMYVREKDKAYSGKPDHKIQCLPVARTIYVYNSHDRLRPPPGAPDGTETRIDTEAAALQLAHLIDAQGNPKNYQGDVIGNSIFNRSLIGELVPSGHNVIVFYDFSDGLPFGGNITFEQIFERLTARGTLGSLGHTQLVQTSDDLWFEIMLNNRQQGYKTFKNIETKTNEPENDTIFLKLQGLHGLQVLLYHCYSAQSVGLTGLKDSLMKQIGQVINKAETINSGGVYGYQNGVWFDYGVVEGLTQRVRTLFIREANRNDFRSGDEPYIMWAAQEWSVFNRRQGLQEIADRTNEGVIIRLLYFDPRPENLPDNYQYFGPPYLDNR
ncbi:MAG: putative Ig domain-containing protein [Candidatus Brocadiia bacterium]